MDREGMAVGCLCRLGQIMIILEIEVTFISPGYAARDLFDGVSRLLGSIIRGSV